MRKTSCIMVMVVFLAMAAGISVNSAYAAGCKDKEVSCCINGEQSETVAKTKFTMCWSWRKAECVPCNNDGQWAYLAQWCNVNYINECHGACQGCFKVHNPFFMTPKASVGGEEICCVDDYGHQHCR